MSLRDLHINCIVGAANPTLQTLLRSSADATDFSAYFEAVP
jgi:hypothetical protein